MDAFICCFYVQCGCKKNHLNRCHTRSDTKVVIYYFIGYLTKMRAIFTAKWVYTIFFQKKLTQSLVFCFFLYTFANEQLKYCILSKEDERVLSTYNGFPRFHYRHYRWLHLPLHIDRYHPLGVGIVFLFLRETYFQHFIFFN